MARMIPGVTLLKVTSWGVVLGAKMARSWSVTTYVTEIVVGKPTWEQSNPPLSVAFTSTGSAGSAGTDVNLSRSEPTTPRARGQDDVSITRKLPQINIKK